MIDLLARIQRRLDAEALTQLRAEAARLAVENGELHARLVQAEGDAEGWREDATAMHLQLCEQLGGTPGVTPDGALVVVSA